MGHPEAWRWTLVVVATTNLFRRFDSRRRGSSVSVRFPQASFNFLEEQLFLGPRNASRRHRSECTRQKEEGDPDDKNDGSGEKEQNCPLAAVGRACVDLALGGNAFRSYVHNITGSEGKNPDDSEYSTRGHQ